MSTEVQIHEKLPLAQAIPLGLQHVFSMFGATVLVLLNQLFNTIKPEAL